MKRLLAVFILTLCFSTTAFAGYRAGVHGGINTSGLDFRVADQGGFTFSVDEKTKIMGGLYIEKGAKAYGLPDWTHFQFEINYSAYEFDMDAVAATAPTTILRTTFDLAYIELPLYLKGKWLDGSWHPVLYAGPKAMFKMSDDVTTSTVSNGIAATATATTADLASFGFGLEFGGGFEYDAGDTWALTLDGRYGWGMTNLGKGTGFKARNLQVLAGAVFDL